jgi:hypothetical protein
MRLILIPFILILCSINLFAQDYINGEFESVATSPVPVIKFPQFKGGKKGLDNFLKDNIIIPESLSDVDRKGVVVIMYKVDTKGQVIEARIDMNNTTLNSAFHEMILQVVKRAKPWKPGTKNSKPFIASLQISFEF